ncbi:hypothetical protein GUJ93_ZPchr0004g39376 [Zizania palustris]|uniref:40S ribosomal protein S21 n=1 Tax=Zizania palustris TaxID=103762 RepID=A0A8J5VY70_ZIZPA|nr:hypothetical protein GUJ93_ZPchr0004g39376 [Zizania palustris]
MFEFAVSVAVLVFPPAVAKMQNEEGQMVDLYVPRKCSATNRIITAKDHASVQINIGHVMRMGYTMAASPHLLSLGSSVLREMLTVRWIGCGRRRRLRLSSCRSCRLRCYAVVMARCYGAAGVRVQWPAGALAGAFLDVALVWACLCAAAVASAASRLLALFGLRLPCTCARPTSPAS